MSNPGTPRPQAKAHADAHDSRRCGDSPGSTRRGAPRASAWAKKPRLGLAKNQLHRPPFAGVSKFDPQVASSLNFPLQPKGVNQRALQNPKLQQNGQFTADLWQMSPWLLRLMAGSGWQRRSTKYGVIRVCLGTSEQLLVNIKGSHSFA